MSTVAVVPSQGALELRPTVKESFSNGGCKSGLCFVYLFSTPQDEIQSL